jgi:hypothetical protein
VFITAATSDGPEPQDITVQNSTFGPSVTYNVQNHSNAGDSDTGWTFAYNTFTSDPFGVSGSPGGVTFIGNLGFRAQTCFGWTWTKNVWQWSTGTPCGTDTRVDGDDFSTDQLDFNADFTLQATSPAIDAAETSYCTSTLGSVDRFGNSRPVNSVCDAGAAEYQG